MVYTSLMTNKGDGRRSYASLMTKKRRCERKISSLRQRRGECSAAAHGGGRVRWGVRLLDVDANAKEKGREERDRKGRELEESRRQMDARSDFNWI
jgi:hypothetical protein